MNKNDPAFPMQDRDSIHAKAQASLLGIDDVEQRNVTYMQARAAAIGGLTARQYAAIHLCIPDSGVDWLDAMIRRKQRDDLAAKMLEGVASNPANAYAVADAMLKVGDPDFAEVKNSGA